MPPAGYRGGVPEELQTTVKKGPTIDGHDTVHLAARVIRRDRRSICATRSCACVYYCVSTITGIKLHGICIRSIIYTGTPYTAVAICAYFITHPFTHPSTQHDHTSKKNILSTETIYSGVYTFVDSYLTFAISVFEQPGAILSCI